MLTNMYTLNIQYKQQTSKFGKLVEEFWTNNKTPIHPKTYANEFLYSMFYDRLFQVQTARPGNNIFKDTVKNIGINGKIAQFAQDAWVEYFPKRDIVFIDAEVPDSDDEIESVSDKEEYDIYVIKSKESFETQIAEIIDAVPHVSPGGILLVEGIFKNIPTKDYLLALQSHLHHFQDYYIANLDHSLTEYIDRGSEDTQVLVLINKGPSFALPTPMITIITPSCRPQNLLRIKESIPMDWVKQWIIVYDGKRISENPNQFIADSPKIKEYVFQGEGTSGNPQRNFALNLLNQSDMDEGYLYFVDDDNTFHVNLARWLPFLDGESLYSFDQYNRIKGDTIALYQIDTAMVLFPYRFVKGERWILELYNADGHYIIKCFSMYPKNWVYIANDLCFYNSITP